MTELGPPESLPPPDLVGILNLAEHAEASKAIIASGIVEDWLQTLLLGAGRTLSNTLLTKFFEGYVPLSNFSAKIDIAYFFELIDDITFKDLRAIKDMRNCFAHTKKVVTFTSDDVRQKGQALTGWSKDTNLRDLYFDRAQFCLDQMRVGIEGQIIAFALSARE
jgi:hypothetical protein